MTGTQYESYAGSHGRPSGGTIDDHWLCREKGLDVDKLAQMVAGILGIDVAEVWEGGQKSSSVRARDLMGHWARDIGFTPTAVGKKLKLSQSGASRTAQRGKELATSRGWSLKDLLSR